MKHISAYRHVALLWNIILISSQLVRALNAEWTQKDPIKKWYSRACGSYQDSLDRWLLLTKKLLNQGFILAKLKSSLRKLYGRHHDLVDRYGISVSQMTTNMLHLSQTLPDSFLIHDLSLGL